MNTFTSSPQMIPSWISWRSLLSLFLILGGLVLPSAVLAQSQSDNAAYLNIKPTSSSSTQQTYYAGKRLDNPYKGYTRLGNPNSSPVVPTPDLGVYDLDNNSSITLTGGAIVAANARGFTITRAAMLYRVYLVGTPSAQLPVPSQLTLPLVGTTSLGENIYQTNVSTIDLLNGLTSGGNYTIDVQFQLTVQSDDDNSITTTTDPNGSYALTFYITPPPVTPAGGTTTWQGVVRGANNTVLPSDTEWTNTANWSNGVPNAKANAVIPAKITASQVYPILNDQSYPYEVLSLNIDGSDNTAGAVTINVATLKVFGDLLQRGGGLSGGITGASGVLNDTQNSTLVFAGDNQLITGQVNVSDIIVAGSGIKSIINAVNPLNIIAFQPTSITAGTIIQSAAYDVTGNIITSYSLDASGNSYVDLGNNAIISAASGQAETGTSYIRGVTRSSRNITTGVLQNFGNLGIDVTTSGNPGNVIVQRVVGRSLQGPAVTTVPTKRRYRLEGYENSGSSAFGASKLDIVFHYINSSDELNGIAESNLSLFSTTTNGAPYTALGGTLDQTNQTVSRAGIASLPRITFTLGDKTNPLPVSLTAFTATRSNTNAVLAWTTASELDNAGFEVQVSTDGNIFRKLAFVASQNSNSNQKLNYTYTDAENGKTGVRYYRLRQIDNSGEEAFSLVRAVNFSGAALASSALSAYPNPFSDKLDFNLDATTVGNGTARVQLVDMTGRLVREENLTVSNASLSLTNLNGLRSGLYMAKIMLADGTTQTVRIQKQ